MLSSDETVFGGYANVAAGDDVVFHTEEREHDNRPRSMLVYAPSRTCVVYAPADFVDSQAPYDGAPKYAVPGLAVKGLGPYFGV
nr:CAZy families CBM48/GH13 protein [uncultured bacterium]